MVGSLGIAGISGEDQQWDVSAFHRLHQPTETHRRGCEPVPSGLIRHIFATQQYGAPCWDALCTCNLPNWRECSQHGTVPSVSPMPESTTLRHTPCATSSSRSSFGHHPPCTNNCLALGSARLSLSTPSLCMLPPTLKGVRTGKCCTRGMSMSSPRAALSFHNERQHSGSAAPSWGDTALPY